MQTLSKVVWSCETYKTRAKNLGIQVTALLEYLDMLAIQFTSNLKDQE